MVLVGMHPVLTQVPPKQAAFEDRDFHARGRQTAPPGRAGLPGSNDDRVVWLVHEGGESIVRDTEGYDGLGETDFAVFVPAPLPRRG